MPAPFDDSPAPPDAERVAERVADLVNGLDAGQHQAVMSDAAPLAILAGAGSGKTRVLARRIARRSLDGSADARHILALTFTRKAASELVSRLDSFGLHDRPTAGTFHAVAYGVLRQRWQDTNRAAPDLLTNRARLVASVVSKHVAERGSRLAVGEVTAEIDWAKARLVAPAQYAAAARRAGRRPPGSADATAEMFRAYEDAKRTKRLVDFDDLLALCAREIHRDEQFAEVQRWRFRHLFVDEFQDVNPLQMQLLEAWRGGRSDLCVVGDPSQAIYGWNGADPTLLRNVERTFPGVTIVRLDTNYRSRPAIVAAAAKVVGLEAPTTLRPDGAAVGVGSYANEADEAAGIASIVRAAHDGGTGWRHCAVLTRTNAQIGPIEEALAAVGVPLRRREASVADEPAARAALRSAGTFAGPVGLRAWAEDLQAMVSEQPVGDRDVLDTLVTLAFEHLATESRATVSSFRTWLATGGSSEVGRRDCVDVMTFHAAKGLEWSVVVVAGCENGLVPHSGASDEAALEEERRLFHVALTRAGDELHCTWAMRRGSSARRPSPYLEALADDAPPTFLPPAELVVRRPKPAPEPVHAALVMWRTSAAKAAGLPVAAVCTDTVLAALARDRPITIAELEAVPGMSVMAARRLGPRILAVISGALDAQIDRSATTGA